MIHAFKPRHLCLAAALALTTAAPLAASLGQVKGSAVLGQSLNLAVEVGLDGTEPPELKCFSAQVMLGDAPLAPSLLQLSLKNDASAQGLRQWLQVESSSVVNEPFLSLWVRIGCGVDVSRRYVLLADLAPGATPPVLSVAGAEAPGARGVRAVAVPTQVEDRVSASSPAAPGPVRPARVAADQPAPVVKVTPSRERQPAKVRPTERPRLALDMLDLPESALPGLRLSTSLVLPATENLAQRAEAQRLWRVLNTPPENALKQLEALEAREHELQSLKLSALNEAKQIRELRQQLEDSESQRYANPLVYGLIAALLVSLGLVAWSSRRNSQQLGRRWWQVDKALDEGDLLDAMDTAAHQGRPGLLERVRRQTQKRGKAAAAPLASPTLDDSDFSPAAAQPPEDGPAFDFSSGFVETPRTAQTEELFDIQQQAEFFVSLGQHEQAIELLTQHIQRSEDTSPLAYLDLLKIYHMLGRREDYARVRETFNRVYTTVVPEFDAFTLPTHGLTAYPAALSRIETLWGTPKVLGVIEESIFRKPGRDSKLAFTLEAYCELLLLHAIAKSNVEPPSAHATSGRRRNAFVSSGFSDEANATAKPTFGDTEITPLSTSGFAPSQMADLLQPTPLEAPSLDIDLGAVAEEPVVAIDLPIDLDSTVAVAAPMTGASMDEAEAAAGVLPMLDFSMPDPDPEWTPKKLAPGPVDFDLELGELDHKPMQIVKSTPRR